MVDTKPSLYQGPFIFRCLEKSTDINSIGWGTPCHVHCSNNTCVILCICWRVLLSVQMCIYVYSAFCPYCSAIFRHFGSWGQLIWVSVPHQQCRGTKWLIDSWLAVWDEVRHGNRGMCHKLGGIAHACIYNGYKHRLKMKRREGDSAMVGWCTMGLLVSEKFHAPISNTHINTHTHRWPMFLPSYPHQTKWQVVRCRT